MPTNVAPVVWIGTSEGLLRWQAGSLTPVAGDMAITALARLPGGRVVAATASGQLLEADREGHARLRGALAQQCAITSLLPIAGRGERLLCGTADGALVELREDGAMHAAPFRGGAAPLQVVGVPGRPRSAMLISAGGGGWFASDADASPEPWFEADAATLLDAIPHPIEGQLWLARTESALVRSNDGARTFRPVAGWPADLRPRRVCFSGAAPWHAWAVAFPRREPPDPSDPSPLWTSVDGGQSFHPIASRLIDRERDPVGEITSVTTLLERDHLVVLLGTDRGELLSFGSGPQPARLLADHLAPIDHLLGAGTAPIVDPSTSGIFLLP